MSDNPRIFLGANRPPSDWVDHKTDAGASALYGAMVGLESREFDGNMALTGMTLDKSLELFLQDVAAQAGIEAASIYASRLIQGLERFVIHNTGMKTTKTKS